LQTTTQKDFPVHDFILMWQERILAQLLSSTTLTRMMDAELKVPADADALTTAELIQRLTKAVFAEIGTLKEGQYSTRKPAISSLRRNLQRSFLRQLSNLAMGRTAAPQDCQTVAYAELTALRSDIQKLLDSKVKLDAYSQAHLLESSRRIEKVLDAGVENPQSRADDKGALETCREVFDLAMAVRMISVRGLGRHPYTDRGKSAGDNIDDRLQCVGKDG
jgi:hypothetical protein